MSESGYVNLIAGQHRRSGFINRRALQTGGPLQKKLS
jgi:hypothetical protein